jgi:O-antigen/teichoic acid export membrane protein
MAETSIQTAAGLSQRSRLSFLLKDSALYGGAAAISKAFALITFPLLARHFTVAMYGVLDYFMVLAGLFATFFIFGQDSAVARYFYEYEATDDRRQLISQSLVFQLAGLAFLLPLLWLSADSLTPLLTEAPDGVLLFKIVLLQLPFLLLINFSQNLLKWTFARARFLTMSLGFTVVHATLLVIAVMILDVGIHGVLLVSLITSAVFGALGLFFVRQWLTRPKDFRRLREMLPFAIPYGVICVVGAFSPTLERTLTYGLLGAEELGLYAAATKIAMLVGVLASAFQTAWGPFSLSLYKQADADHTYNWVLKLFALGMCVSALVLTLLAQPLIHLLATDRYSNAVIVVFPLAMGLSIQATSWITEIGIGISKRSYLNLYSYSVAIAVTLAGIWLLAPEFGLLGVGMGVLLGHLAKAVISSWLGQRAYRLHWHYAPVIILMSATLVLGLVATWVGQQFGTAANNLALVVNLFVVLLMGWGLLLDRAEQGRVIALVRARSPLFPPGA